jgi:uncharacterized membrane protein YcaP (DUF421 family)
MIIHNGDVLLDHMAKEHLSMDELDRAMREHGISSSKDVSIGVLEVDGSISLLKFDDIPVSAQVHKRTRFVRKPE